MVIKVKYNGEWVKIPYLSTGADSSINYVEEAPKNGQQYTRKDGAWTVLNIPNVNADWNAVEGNAQILNKPTLATVATSGQYSDLTGIPSLSNVATSGSYNDLSNKPTIITSDEVDQKINTAVGSVYRVKGTVANFEALPTIDVVVGDVYNLEDTGANYVATSTTPTWNKLSETVDLSAYSTTAQNDEKYQPKGNYSTSFADEEDITVDENNLLKFKDKEYSPKDYSGMGRKVLRKHYINGINTLTQHMINKPNTIYVIQYDYCLADQTIEIPENCVLQFEGGSFRNGTLIGSTNNNITNIENNVILKNINLKNFDVKEAEIEWFTSDVENYSEVDKAFENVISITHNIRLRSKTYYISKPITLRPNQKIYGNFYSSTIKAYSDVEYIFKLKNGDGNIAFSGLSINNLFIDGNNKAKYGIYCYYVSANSKIENIVVQNCTECGLYVSKCWYAFYKNIRLQYNKIGLHIDTLSSQEAVNGINFDKIYCVGNELNLYVYYSTSVTFSYCTFERATGDYEILIENIYNNIGFIGCHVETSTGVIKTIPAYEYGGTLNIINCYFSFKILERPAFELGYLEYFGYIGNTTNVRDNDINNIPDCIINTNAKNNVSLGRGIYYSGVPTFNDTANVLIFGSENASSQIFRNCLTHQDLNVPGIKILTNDGRDTPISSHLELGAQIPEHYSDIYGLLKLIIQFGNELDNKVYFNILRKHNDDTALSNSFSIDNYGIVRLYNRLIGQLILPHYSSNENRPNADSPGWLRFNEDTKKLEVSTGVGSWVTANGDIVDGPYVSNSGNRPTSPNEGFQYFDTTIKKPIWWTGEKWVDATGAQV